MDLKQLLFWIALAMTLIFGAYLCVAIAVVVSSDNPSLGTFGDSFGIVTALFSGLAFIGFIYALALQKEELELQRDEIKQMRIIQKRNLELELERSKPSIDLVIIERPFTPKEKSSAFAWFSNRQEFLHDGKAKPRGQAVALTFTRNPPTNINLCGHLGFGVSRRFWPSVGPDYDIEFLLHSNREPAGSDVELDVDIGELPFLSIEYLAQSGQTRMCLIFILENAIIRQVDLALDEALDRIEQYTKSAKAEEDVNSTL